jgi:chemotaxis protein histidine kinase CheA
MFDLDSKEDLEFLQSLRDEFFAESIDRFDDLENMLLSINPQNAEETIQNFKRAIHTIKGSAAAVDLKAFVSLIHLMESQLSDLTKKEISDLALKLLDVMRKYVSHCTKTGIEKGEGFVIKVIKVLEK